MCALPWNCAVSPIEEAAKQVAFLAPLDVTTILFEYDDLVPKPEGKKSCLLLMVLSPTKVHGLCIVTRKSR